VAIHVDFLLSSSSYIIKCTKIKEKRRETMEWNGMEGRERK
jgi:hypothetical protein